ncbi:poly-gamma-glutamate hydrolase family protein [Pararhodobacter sp.]
MAGIHPKNICNRGKAGRSIQPEIPRRLRRAIRHGGEAIARVASALRPRLA